jgi:hypothetical protein
VAQGCPQWEPCPPCVASVLSFLRGSKSCIVYRVALIEYVNAPFGSAVPSLSFCRMKVLLFQLCRSPEFELILGWKILHASQCTSILSSSSSCARSSRPPSRSSEDGMYLSSGSKAWDIRGMTGVSGKGHSLSTAMGGGEWGVGARPPGMVS